MPLHEPIETEYTEERPADRASGVYAGARNRPDGSWARDVGTSDQLRGDEGRAGSFDRPREADLEHSPESLSGEAWKGVGDEW